MEPTQQKYLPQNKTSQGPYQRIEVVIEQVKAFFDFENFKQNYPFIQKYIINSETNAISIANLEKLLQQFYRINAKSTAQAVQRLALDGVIEFSEQTKLVAPVWRLQRSIFFEIPQNLHQEFIQYAEPLIQELAIAFKHESLSHSLKITPITARKEIEHSKAIFYLLFMRNVTLKEKSITINAYIEQEKLIDLYNQQLQKNNLTEANQNIQNPIYGHFIENQFGQSGFQFTPEQWAQYLGYFQQQKNSFVGKQNKYWNKRPGQQNNYQQYQNEHFKSKGNQQPQREFDDNQPNNNNNKIPRNPRHFPKNNNNQNPNFVLRKQDNRSFHPQEKDFPTLE